MKIKCEYCGAFISDTDEKCPNCGGINIHLVRNSNQAPKTIDELKQWYKARNLPPEEITRFFIGTNYKNPRAFGIYKNEETGNFIVYKNKGDGTRAIRYEGKDEAYAVNELYIKLKEEIVNQKSRSINSNSTSTEKYRNDLDYYRSLKHGTKQKSNLKLFGIVFGFYAFFIVLIIIANILTPNRGYYNYNNSHYYYQNGAWYIYDSFSGWEKTTVPDDLKDHHNSYYDSSYYDYSYDIDRFEDSGYYVEPSSSSSDSSWDSSSDWSSSDSWDSSSSDWDSDW